MKHIFFTFFFAFTLFPLAFAEGTDEKTSSSGAHTSHPPHDHHEPNHLKYLKDTDHRRKRQHNKYENLSLKEIL